MKSLAMHVLTSALLGFLLITGTLPAEAATVSTTKGDVERTYSVSMTGYNAVPGQTDGDPLTTASGAYSNPNVVAARSDDLASELPFGTVIAIEAAPGSGSCGYGSVKQLIGLRVIADSMNVKMHNKVDILLPNSDTIGGKAQNPALVLGLCKNVTIKVVGHISVSSIPKTQAGIAEALQSGGSEFASAN